MASKGMNKMRGPMGTSAGQYDEGHGGPDDAKSVMPRTRGTEMLVGTMAPLDNKAFSVNMKTGGKPPSNKFD